MNNFQAFQAVTVNDETSTLHGMAGSVRGTEKPGENGEGPTLAVYVDFLESVVDIPVSSLQAL